MDGHFGQNGFTRVADTKVYHALAGTSDGSNTYDGTEIGHYYAIKALVAAVFGAGCVSFEGDNLATGDVLAAGDIIYGKFQAVQVSEGTLLLYRARSKG
jgi:hypothetical protein